MINYNNLAKSIEFYEIQGYKRIEAPWLVPPCIDNITKPKNKRHYMLKHNNKCLVASGEQSFMYLYLKENLPLGKFQTITPCFRDERYDLYHEKYFMKNELKQQDPVMILCECSDLIGAIKHYAKDNWNINMEDLIKFNNKTENAFKKGRR